ncbi:PRC-barrel domain-containing protein [Leptolyngbya sp. 7M]|uniref:PRC-barrel domain-containing protein n=1 Tax=Leptolyngbya sp. 7M TaxID=2812896 RepID=UPI001B8B71D4|nr:PRC-barrel domain-containing protein [Leptolyngbya sp. 7M]QYO68120.1 PRC-barrel domain-containing protein [Leptolyngbya sp. 7M]
MALKTIDEYDLNSNRQPGSYRISGFGVYSDLIAGMLASKTEEKIGTVTNALVDDMGQIQYIVVDLGTNPSGREVLLSADRARIDQDQRRVYATGLSKEQAEQLPAYNAQMQY